MAFYNIKTIQQIHSALKDETEVLKRSNLVYKIPCSCGKAYIGQTKQRLGVRVNQHKNDCKNDHFLKKEKTALATHHFDTGHSFKFDEVTILDYEDNWLKRNISEMIFIKTNNTVNLRTDTNHLSVLYSDILKMLAKR